MKQSKFFCCLFLSVFFINCNSYKSNHQYLHNEYSNLHYETKQESYYGEYSIEDKNYGTKTEVKINGDERIMTTNSLPNHKVGKFPNQGNPNSISSQNRTYTFPLDPKYTGKPKWVREPGVALNGVKFEPGTAEVVVCDTGENYRLEALQNVIDLGLDFNHAHVQPSGAYHYHGTPTLAIENFDKGEDLVHIGFAHDGFPIYYSKSNMYKSSYRSVSGNRKGKDCTYENPMQRMDISVSGHYNGMFTSDFEYAEGYGDLDECNGAIIDGNYAYLVTIEFPYVSRCLMGEFKEERSQRRSQNNDTTRGRNQHPSFAELLEMMDANSDSKLSKNEVKGPLQQDFEHVDTNKDGFITQDELKSPPRGRIQDQGRRH